MVIVRFSSEFIAKRLEEMYSLKLNKELEKYKSNLDNKIYISKTKFDTEFSIYRELSKTFFNLVLNIGTMIPSGITFVPADEETRKKYDDECYSNARKIVIEAQDALFSNTPFIPDKLFVDYEEILKLCRRQLSAYEKRWNLLYVASKEVKESFSDEDYSRTDDIQKKLNELNINIREYLSRLDVLD